MKFKFDLASAMDQKRGGPESKQSAFLVRMPSADQLYATAQPPNMQHLRERFTARPTNISLGVLKTGGMDLNSPKSSALDGASSMEQSPASLSRATIGGNRLSPSRA